MTNKYRGEVEFEASGEKYVLRAGAKENASAETELGLVDPLSNMVGMTVNQMVTLFRHMLSNRHPDITQDQAADLITEIGMFSGAMKLLGRSARLANGLPEYETDEEKAKNVERVKKLQTFMAKIENTGEDKLSVAEVREMRASYLASLMADEPESDPKAPRGGSTGSPSAPAAFVQD